MSERAGVHGTGDEAGRPGRSDEAGRPGRRDEAAGPPGPADFARSCLERLLRQERPPAPPQTGFYARRAACFVSLKRRGELRGCIGTLVPAEPDLGREIVRNAAAAAFQDPRFPPVTAEELDDLTCSVDVLSPSEPAALEDLDPSLYGVIVCCSGRRGVLLPDLAGVDTVECQVDIALQKAGLDGDAPYDLERFTVERYREGDPAPP